MSARQPFCAIVGFLVAMAVVLMLWAWQILVRNDLLPLPELAMRPFVKVNELYEAPFLGMEVPGSAQWVYNGFWSTIHILPFAIGVTFLIASDVGFRCGLVFSLAV